MRPFQEFRSKRPVRDHEHIGPQEIVCLEVESELHPLGKKCNRRHARDRDHHHGGEEAQLARAPIPREHA